METGRGNLRANTNGATSAGASERQHSSLPGWLVGLAVGGAAVVAAAVAYGVWRHLRGAQPAKASGRACQSCGTTTGVKERCSRCRKVWYCSRECQRQDWSRHKPECAAAAPAPAPAPATTTALPEWAKGMTNEEYAEVQELIRQNDEQFQRHILQGGPRPDSVDDIWEDFTPEERRQLIEDTLWYKEFYAKHGEEASKDLSVPAFIRRYSSMKLFENAPAAVSFFSAVLRQQSGETLQRWIDHYAQDFREHDEFTASFLALLRYANSDSCRECADKLVSLLPAEKMTESAAVMSLEVPKFVTDPLNQPLQTANAIDHLWATYYATGDAAYVERLIKQGLPLGAQARALAALKPTEAQMLMQLCNKTVASLINEGIFDEAVRRVCASGLTELAESDSNLELVSFLQEIIKRQQDNIRELAPIPAEDVERMRVEVDGHRPFIERIKELKHHQKVERLRRTPGVRQVPSRFGQALWIPPASPGQRGRLFMTMEE